jgi:TolB protein
MVLQSAHGSLRGTLLVLALSGPLPLSGQNPNPVNLFIADITWRNDRPVIGAARKLTRDNGTNSQPSFTPDGSAVLFSGLRSSGADARSDIYRIDLATGNETRVTSTPENENSPTMNRAGEYLAVRWVPATLFREYGVWVYSGDGTPTRGVLRGPDTTGYYVPLDNGDFALMRPTTRFSVALFTSTTGSIEDLDSPVAALPPQRIPGAAAISYTRTDSGGRNEIRRAELTTRQLSTIAPTLPGRTVHSWIPDRGTLLMAKGSTVYARRPRRDTEWIVAGSFDSPEMRNLAAYVVSPRGDKLVMTSTLKLPINTAIRDSLEGGRSVRDVVAAFAALSDGGRLGDYFLAPGLLGLADDRRLVRQGADEILFVDFVRTLFPASHQVWARLGDAHAGARDTPRALEAYRKALELNTRSNAGERAAAERVEKAIRDLGG